MDIFSDEEKQKLANTPFTARLVENFDSLEDVIWNLNTSNENRWIVRTWYIQNVLKRYDTLLTYEKDAIPEDDSTISKSVYDIVTLYTPRKRICDGMTLLGIVNYYVYRVLSLSEDYSDLHSLFLTPLLNDYVFKCHLQDPLVMRFVFTCIIHCNEPLEYNVNLDRKLNTFYLDVQKVGREVYWCFLEDMTKRTAIFKEDLVAAVWHPRRVEKWLEAGGFELLEAL
jgi:hypothetical protein